MLLHSNCFCKSVLHCLLQSWTQALFGTRVCYLLFCRLCVTQWPATTQSCWKCCSNTATVLYCFCCACSSSNLEAALCFAQCGLWLGLNGSNQQRTLGWQRACQPWATVGLSPGKLLLRQSCSCSLGIVDLRCCLSSISASTLTLEYHDLCQPAPNDYMNCRKCPRCKVLELWQKLIGHGIGGTLCDASRPEHVRISMACMQLTSFLVCLLLLSR